MTEKEIIEYLKQNKENGVVFAFMPPEVIHWCGFNSTDKIFRVYNGMWLEPSKVDRFESRYAYCLDKDYEPKTEFEPHWEEFEVNEKGRFYDDGDFSYPWYRWFDFLNINADRYNNFGGWLYTEGDNQMWSMTPRIIVCNSAIAWTKPEIESKPATPVKIRFWRYKE